MKYCLFAERKIASMTNEQLLNLSRLDDVDEEDEDEVQAAEMEPVAVAITVKKLISHWMIRVLFHYYGLLGFHCSHSSTSSDCPHSESREEVEGKAAAWGNWYVKYNYNIWDQNF